MGLVGRLEDLALPDLLQILALTKKTGKLTLTRREGTGVIVFRSGRVIYAATDAVRETLGNALVSQRLMTEPTLLAALEAQHRSPMGKGLGPILVERGCITQETLEKVIGRHIETVICEVLGWKKGFFTFDISTAPDDAQIEVDAKDFLLPDGLSVDYLLLEGLRRLDEERREQTLAQAPPHPRIGLPNAATAQPPEPRPAALSPLKAVLAGIRSPVFASEVTLTFMRLAAEVVNRGVLFSVTHDEIRGMGQFGLEAQGMNAGDLVRKFVLPLQQPSVLQEVHATRRTYRGKLWKTPGNESLVRQLGGAIPQEVVAIPMIVHGGVVVIFYGDDLPTNRPLRDIEGLEFFMIHAGLVMEKNLLEEKLQILERKQHTTGSQRV